MCSVGYIFFLTEKKCFRAGSKVYELNFILFIHSVMCAYQRPSLTFQPLYLQAKMRKGKYLHSHQCYKQQHVHQSLYEGDKNILLS